MAVNGEAAPGGFAFEDAEGPNGGPFPETFVNIAAVDSGFGRGPIFG